MARRRDRQPAPQEKVVHTLLLETRHGEILKRESETLPPQLDLALVSVKVWEKPVQYNRVRSRFKQVEGCRYKEIE